MSTPHKSILKFAAAGGVLSALVIFAGTWLLGNIGESEAMSNLREIRPTLRFTASGSMTTAATILALMLTLLSFSNTVERQVKQFHYERIHWIALLSAITFIAALILLMLLNIPINNAEESFGGIYNIIYYILISYVALLGGIITTVVLLLYGAVNDVILLVRPDADSSHLIAEAEAKRQEEIAEAESGT